MTRGLAIYYDHRKAARGVDAVGRPCGQCAVATVANPLAACKHYRVDGPPCVIARGRYRRAYRSAIVAAGNKPHLETSIDRFAMLCGEIEQMKIERAALLTAGQSVADLDAKLTQLHRQISTTMRECGLAAHVNGTKEAEYDTALFAG